VQKHHTGVLIFIRRGYSAAGAGIATYSAPAIAVNDILGAVDTGRLSISFSWSLFVSFHFPHCNLILAPFSQHVSRA
jgi:hypothetical protein